MQKRMGLCYVSKIILLLNIAKNILEALILRRFLTLNNIEQKLKKVRVKKSKNPSSLHFIFKWEMLLTKFFFIKNCLTRCIALFLSLKKLGFNPEINIGVNSNNQFSSHSWISIDGLNYLKDNNNFSRIYKIK